ncbi:MMPL family transporter [Streptomyces sp. NBC_01794]|uniref:MMPL family transporter n=1 Tax=Streptomyces sp. NBC_01794 TaxID=2975942 RepID=UPI00308C6B40|nr:MMPL family transporter [Streptomyces sp. NBC_01794]WSB05179.1 MMPL family transporter [Streptomyces sp. NBC_01794]
MATFLYRLGCLAYRRRRLVILFWLVLLAVLVACMTAFGGHNKLNDEFTIPGSESQQALDAMKNDFPTAAGTSAQIVFIAPSGKRVTDASFADAIKKVDDAAKSAPQVAGVVSPSESGLVSDDGSTAVTQVLYTVSRTELEDATLTALEDVTGTAGKAGLTTHVGGLAFNGGGGDGGSVAGDIVGLTVALAVLAVTFGSLMCAGMPLLTALTGVGVGVTGVLSLTGAATISQTAVTLATMIGLAVGIDYALFILSRHRSQLAQGVPVRESVGRAIGTAGSAVVFAGLTVIIALVGLAIVNIPFLTVMGLAAAGAVMVAVGVATTLLPALFGLAGERLRPARDSKAARREQSMAAGIVRAPNFGERWARRATRRPLLTVLAVVAVLGLAAIPATSLSLALPDNSSASSESSQRQAFDQISETLGSGVNGPLIIFADTAGSKDAEQATQQIAQTVSSYPGVAAVSQPQINAKAETALIQVIPDSGPSDEATADLVNTIRDNASALQHDTGAKIKATGTTAVQVDVSEQLRAALLPFTAVVVGLSLVLLLLVFRSLLVPLKAAGGFLLSVAATFGAVVAVFQWGWLSSLFGVDATGPVASFLPIILIAVLFGLAMDYEVFLVSRMRETYVRTGDPRGCVHAGARHASRVVTAAALIMIAVFASFTYTDDMILKQIAFSLALGVTLDAFLVRMTLVPAVLVLAGRAAWWLPRPLARLLPDLDIEGEKLHTAADSADTSTTTVPVIGQ